MSGWTNLTGTQVQPAKKQAAKKVAIPVGYDSNEEFLSEMRVMYDQGSASDQLNRDAGIDDIKFTVGEQWDPVVADRRRKKNRPVLTVNRLPAFVGQVVNQRLMNETDIRVLPDNGGTKAIAALREGLIRSIYKNSNADMARDEAMKYQVICGVGFFALKIDYTSNDVFDQDIRLRTISDPYAVVMDPLSVEPSGADANYAFITDEIPKEAFKKQWPNAPVVDFGSSQSWTMPGIWYQEDTVRVCEYWRMVEGDMKTLALMTDGTTQDVTDMEDFEYLPFVVKRSDGSPYTREVRRKLARMYLVSGSEILDGPFDYELSSLPVFRVPGWEVRITDRVYRWGLVRFLKDPMRLHNFWRSTIAEQLVAAPRNKWMSTPDAVQGYEKQWRQSNISDDPLMLYNEGTNPPTQVPPPQMDAALINEANTAVQDIKDVSNIHEAGLGIQSNEVSGKAIQARQQITDVGTFIYQDRLRIADERCAVLIDELIPQIYDGQRMTTIMGRDSKEVLAVINNPMDPNSDVTLGKYKVTIATGPSTVTKRQLAAEQMETFVNAHPEQAGKVMDLIAEAQDWPKSDEFARRFRLDLPPGIVPEDEMTDAQKQAQQQAQQKQQMVEQLAQAKAQAEITLIQAEAMEKQARAIQLQASAEKALADARARTLDVESKSEERVNKSIHTLASTQFNQDQTELMNTHQIMKDHRASNQKELMDDHQIMHDYRANDREDLQTLHGLIPERDDNDQSTDS